MITCDTILVIAEGQIEVIFFQINLFVSVFVGGDPNPAFNHEVLINHFINHRYASIHAFVDLAYDEFVNYREEHEFSSTIRAVHSFLCVCISYLRNTLIYALRYYCYPQCPYYIEPPVAVAQADVGDTVVDNDDISPINHILRNFQLPGPLEQQIDLPSEDPPRHVPLPAVSDTDFDLEQILHTLRNLNTETEIAGDVPPEYEHPPNFFGVVDQNLYPITILRYSLEVFQVLWDHVCNGVTQSSTRQLDMQDFVAIQEERDAILEGLSTTELTYGKYVEFLRLCENLFDRVKWYGLPRREEYFRRHNKNHLATLFVHKNCPACVSGMLHCYKEKPYVHECPQPEKCQRNLVRKYFQPNCVIPYEFLWHIITQRKSFKIDKIFQFYAKDNEMHLLELFLDNVEASMKKFGLRTHPAEFIEGVRYELSFPPRPFHCLEPQEWKDIYNNHFSEITGYSATKFAKFISIALTGSIRQARLFYITPDQTRSLLWDGSLPWDFVEPYARNTEPLEVKLVLDSIFKNFRNGLRWNLKEEISSIITAIPSLRQSWPRPSDPNLYFFWQQLLN
jgi:hypothetical protein